MPTPLRLLLLEAVLSPPLEWYGTDAYPADAAVARSSSPSFAAATEAVVAAVAVAVVVTTRAAIAS